MLEHVTLSLLVFEHGFIRICFGIFEFFSTISFLLNFTRYLFSANTSFYWWESNAMNVESISWKHFMFHEMILKLYIVKSPEIKIWQCILPLTVGPHPPSSNVTMLPMIDLDPSNYSCIYSILLRIFKCSTSLLTV